MATNGFKMGAGGAAREGLASASSLADAAADWRRVQLGDAGRRCAGEGCGKLLARMNRDTLCFACQAGREDQILRGQARPVRIEELMGMGPRGDLRLRGKRVGR